MANPELLMKLRQLHEELSLMEAELNRLDGVDESTIDALGQLTTDVSALVDRANQITKADEPAAAHESDVFDRIHKFESEHPQVTRFLSQLTDVLASIGI
ncbi:MAG: DUF4404 family protein [Pirellulaceae bacterium]